MNICCANCSKKISYDKYKEILCHSCEILWWQSIYDLYEEKLKTLKIGEHEKSKTSHIPVEIA
jgi:hypothetical protein